MRNVVIAGFARSAFTLANKGALMRVRAAFMQLIKSAGTLARIEHLLVTGKPLRN
jgi:3-hydroxyacyl-CoA dehydrogenase